MTSKFTREELLNIIETDHVQCGEASALARMALAAMDSEPVAWEYEEYVYVSGLGHLWREKLDCEFPGIECGTLRGVVPLYRHMQQPVVRDESYQQLSELYHAQEKRLFKIAQRIKGPAFDKYSHSPSQAIDVLEAAIFGENEACCAAMLQAGNSPVIPDGYVMVPKEPTKAMILSAMRDNETGEVAEIYDLMLTAAQKEMKGE